MNHSMIKMSGFEVYGRLLGYVKPYKFIFALAILGSILFSGIDAGMTYLLRPLLNRGFIARESDVLIAIPMLVVLLVFLRSTGSFTSKFCLSWVSRKVVMRLRQDIFQHLIRLPTSFYDKSSSGELLSKIIYDIEQVAQASSESLTTLLQSTVLVLGLILVMLLMSWQLTLLYLVAVPIIAILVKVSSKHLRKFSVRVQSAIGSVSHLAKEGIEGNKVIKSFTMEDFEMDRFNRATEDNRRREMKFSFVDCITSPIVTFSLGCMLSLTLFLATSNFTAIHMTTGSFASFFVAMVGMLKPLKDLTSVNSKIQRGIAGAQSAFSVLAADVEIDRGSKVIEKAHGHIVFQDVTFCYESLENTRVLDHINLEVKPGETIALVGRSGGGKTTLVNLLPRFYDCMDGKISLDGVDIRDYTLKSLRQQIALVSQHVVLFNGTLGHNIAYGSIENFSEEKVIKAVKAAHLDAFVTSLPNDLDTIIGENGLLLSGGQRQRIAIARAILKDAPVLLLDEATSALDTESERHIQAALNELLKNRTTLVVAHRLSTIESADKIVVMEQGKIVEMGTHDELLQVRGIYAKLHRMQFNEEPLNDFDADSTKLATQAT